MLTATFRFGENDRHACRIEFSYFGRERYFVDDVLVHSQLSFTMGGLRRFHAAGYRIEIGVKVHLRSIECDAFVDGIVKARDLFSSINATLAKPLLRRGRKQFWIEMAVWLVIIIAIAAYRKCSAAG